MTLPGCNTIVHGLFVLILIWMFTGCALPQRPSKPVPLPSLLLEPATEPAPEVPTKIRVLKQPIPSEQKPDFYVHEVRWPGETISVIAQWYTSTWKTWEDIVKVNFDFDPKMMQMSDKILIPLDLLKTREPMPRNYLKLPVRKKDVPSSFPSKPAIEPIKMEAVGIPETNRRVVEFDEKELFGPQDTKASVAESNEIELFGPQDTEASMAELDEIELFEPVE